MRTDLYLKYVAYAVSLGFAITDHTGRTPRFKTNGIPVDTLQFQHPLGVDVFYTAKGWRVAIKSTESGIYREARSRDFYVTLMPALNDAAGVIKARKETA